MNGRARIGGTLYLPYQDDEGNDIPIESGEVVYKMSALSVDGQVVRVPATVIAEIKHGVLQPKDLSYGVWTADIRPKTPTAYAKRIKFLADKPEMDLSDVIPIRIDDLDVVKGDEGRHITSVETSEADATIVITMSTGEVYTFPLPHAALDESDRAVLDSALSTLAEGRQDIDATMETLRARMAEIEGAHAENLTRFLAGVQDVETTVSGAETLVQDATRAAGEASTSAQNALQHSEAAHGYSQTAQGLLDALRDGIANGDFKGDAPVITWDGTKLKVNDLPGVDLKGAKGDASTVPGPTGPPGAVLTPESMLVVGPGRPDAPTTTGMTSAALAALPVGAEYRSTDGASVGAWVWRKRPTGWVVTEGDTGWRLLPASAITAWHANYASGFPVSFRTASSGNYIRLGSMSATIGGTIPANTKIVEFDRNVVEAMFAGDAKMSGAVTRGATSTVLALHSWSLWNATSFYSDHSANGVLSGPPNIGFWPTTLPTS